MCMKLIKQFLGKVSVTVDKNDWSINKAYDRLTIVGTSDANDYTVTYISRKPVPKGTALSNTEYWRIIARTDRLTEDIISAVNAAISTVDGMSSTVTDLGNRVGSLEQVSSDHEYDITALEEKVGLLETICKSDDFPDESLDAVVEALSGLIETLQTSDTRQNTDITKLKSDVDTLFRQCIPEYILEAGYLTNGVANAVINSERPIYGTYAITIPSNTTAQIYFMVTTDNPEEFIHAVNADWNDGDVKFKLNGVDIPMEYTWDGDSQIEWVSTNYYSTGTYLIEV